MRISLFPESTKSFILGMFLEQGTVSQFPPHPPLTYVPKFGSPKHPFASFELLQLHEGW
jgi:hypothetical protein